jgi:hypothetical protein
MLIEEELTEQIIGAAIEVHRELGPLVSSNLHMTNAFATNCTCVT